MDRGLVKPLTEPAMILCLCWICVHQWNPILVYMYGKSSSSSLASIPNEVRTNLWLSGTSDAKKKSVRLYVGFSRE